MSLRANLNTELPGSQGKKGNMVSIDERMLAWLPDRKQMFRLGKLLSQGKGCRIRFSFLPYRGLSGI